MKRIICILFALVILAGCTSKSIEVTHDEAAVAEVEEIRAVWISYLDIMEYAQGDDENAFSERVDDIVQNISSAYLNTVFFHVRPFSDALYRSVIFPYSSCISGTEGADPGFDPLMIFCQKASASGLSVHAWINPFRIGRADTLKQKSPANPANEILNDDNTDNDHYVVQVGDMLYYDPASNWILDLNLRGVRELLENYPLDGIHIDDYFYPDTDPSVDRTEYTAYRANGGTMELPDWRRSVINRFVSELYHTVKSFGDKKIFSISPAVQVDQNYDSLYADVARWAALEGYCDWLIPQVYVGFCHETVPFRSAAAQWNDLVQNDRVKLLYGLAAYKCGQSDAYAGSGIDEWTEQDDILRRQLLYCRTLSHYNGFALFSYDAVFGRKVSDNSSEEVYKLISML